MIDMGISSNIMKSSRVLLSDDTVNWLNRLAESRGLSIKVYLNEAHILTDKRKDTQNICQLIHELT